MVEISTTEARTLVSRDSEIGITLGIRSRAIRESGLIDKLREVGLTQAELATASRNSRIVPLLQRLQETDVTGRFNTAEVIAGLVGRWRTSTDTARFGEPGVPGMRKVPVAAATSFAEVSDPIPYVLQEIITARDRQVSPDLSRQWMGVIDESVRRSSEANLAAIDQQAREGGDPVKKKLVIVGGGLLTSLEVSLLGQYFDLTVITRDGRIVEDWRSSPFCINSSTQNDFGPNLPLLSGTTTPIIAQGQYADIDPQILLGGDTKQVLCEDGTTREYISGLKLGEVAATNIISGCSDFITGQEVREQDTTFLPDGTKRLVLRDTATGKVRTLDAQDVFFIPGPGEEVSSIGDERSRRDYDGSLQAIKKQIADARRLIAQYRAELAQIDPRSTRTRDRRRIEALNGKIYSIKIDVPGILSRTSIRYLYDFWQYDQDKNPGSFPLRDIFQEGKSVAVIGGGDTAKTLIELLRGEGPLGAYPNGERPQVIPEITVFGVKDDDQGRRRYADSLGDIGRTSAKVTEVYGRAGRVKVKYSTARLRSRFDYSIVSTGLSKQRVSDRLPREIQLDKLSDLEGNTVALGNERLGIYIIGSGTGFTKQDFPPPIVRIIDGLGIPENTVSAWVNSRGAEGLGLTYLARKGPDIEVLRRYAQFLRTPQSTL